MANENENKQQEEVKEPKEQKSESEIAKAYMDLKENSVSKEEYEKLRNEKEEIIKTIIDKRSISPEAQEKPDLKALCEKWQAPDQTNLEYCQNMLNYRKALIESGEADPFLPTGKDHAIPTDEEIQKAKKVADIMQECIDASDGDSGVFTAMLNSRMVDPNLPKRKK